jgi:hypothetical protein
MEQVAMALSYALSWALLLTGLQAGMRPSENTTCSPAALYWIASDLLYSQPASITPHQRPHHILLCVPTSSLANRSLFGDLPS